MCKYTQLVYGEMKEWKRKKVFEVILAESFPKLMTANHRSRTSENTKYDKYQMLFEDGFRLIKNVFFKCDGNS